MTSKKTKNLKDKFTKSETEDFKIAWKHLNWFLRIILILGILSFVWIMYKIPSWILG